MAATDEGTGAQTPGDDRADAHVLEVTNLSTHIKLSRSTVQAVGNVDLAIDAGVAALNPRLRHG